MTVTPDQIEAAKKLLQTALITTEAMSHNLAQVIPPYMDALRDGSPTKDIEDRIGVWFKIIAGMDAEAVNLTCPGGVLDVIEVAIAPTSAATIAGSIFSSYCATAVAIVHRFRELLCDVYCLPHATDIPFPHVQLKVVLHNLRHFHRNTDIQRCITGVRTECAAALAALARGAGDGRAPAGRYAFKRQGEGWLIRFDGEETILKHSENVQRAWRLIQRQGETLAIEDLSPTPPGFVGHATASETMIDSRATDEYKKRLREICDELEGTALTPDARKALEDERDQLLSHFDVGNKPRRSKSQRNKELDSIRKSLDRFIDSVDRYPRLHAHMKQSIVPKGDGFTYTPSPEIPWES